VLHLLFFTSAHDPIFVSRISIVALNQDATDEEEEKVVHDIKGDFSVHKEVKICTSIEIGDELHQEQQHFRLNLMFTTNHASADRGVDEITAAEKNNDVNNQYLEHDDKTGTSKKWSSHDQEQRSHCASRENHLFYECEISKDNRNESNASLAGDMISYDHSYATNSHHGVRHDHSLSTLEKLSIHSRSSDFQDDDTDSRVAGSLFSFPSRSTVINRVFSQNSSNYRKEQKELPKRKYYR
jgi:hypothetical protein